MGYLDGSKFTVKLLDSQGNAYKNKNVTFNINGVFYTRSTDDDGIAKLNINLMEGEYIITSQYDTAQISNTIKVLSYSDFQRDYEGTR